MQPNCARCQLAGILLLRQKPLVNSVLLLPRRVLTIWLQVESLGFISDLVTQMEEIVNEATAGEYAAMTADQEPDHLLLVSLRHTQVTASHR
jgi:hypothetical protein